MNHPTSLIVGPGAIGSLVCAHTQLISKPWVFQHRPGLKLFSTTVSNGLTIPLNWSLMKANITPDIIWITCKANRAEESTSALLKTFPNAIAVLLHNGLGPQYKLTEQFSERVIWGSTTCGALTRGPGVFEQTSFGQTMLQEPRQLKTRTLLKPFVDISSDHALLNLHFTPNIEEILWRKIMINASINPLTAYYQVQNGNLLDEKYQEEISEICSEINLIMAHLGLSPVKNPVEEVNRVARISKTNWSSMAVDIQQNRETEIDYICGFLVNKAKTLNLNTPFLKKWLKRIADKNVS